MSLVTVVVLAGFVLPKFKVFFASLNAKLPLATRMLLAVTRLLHPMVVGRSPAASAVVVLGALAALTTEAGRHTRDRLLLRDAGTRRDDPVRARRAVLPHPRLDGAAPASRCLRQCGSPPSRCDNLVFTRALSGVSEAMLEGEGLADPLAKTGLFPSTAGR